MDLWGSSEANESSYRWCWCAVAVKHQFIVHLDISGNPQTAPTRPDRVQRLLPRLAQHRTQRAASRRQIHAVQTVKANRPLQIARTHIIHFVDFMRYWREKLWTFSAFR